MTNKARFKFYEKVKIISTLPNKQKVAGEIAAVLGKAQNDNGEWSYAVSVYRDNRCWSMNEEELGFTGEFDKRENFHG
jgi:hypothetical protein